MTNLIQELEGLYLEAKESSIDDEQRLHMLIELLRQIEYMVERGNVATIDTNAEFEYVYEALKTANMDERQTLQLRLEVLRHLSYKA